MVSGDMEVGFRGNIRFGLHFIHEEAALFVAVN